MARVLARAILAGVIAAGAMTIAILWRDEPIASRAQALILIWFAAGAGGFLANYGVIAFATRLGWAKMAILFARFGFLPAFLSIGSLAFLIQNRWQLGGYEPHPDHPIRSMVFSSIQTLILFLVSAPGYLLPWMAPLFVVTGFLLHRSRKPS